MRSRYWIGFVAVALFAAVAIAAGLLVRANELDKFHASQADEALRAAHQVEASASFSLGQLASASAFYRAEGDFSQHEFDLISRSLLRDGSLAATAFLKRVPRQQRDDFEASRGVPIFERIGRNRLRVARSRSVYFPVAYSTDSYGRTGLLGYDVSRDPMRGAALRRARDSGGPTATPVVRLLMGGRGLNVYRPVYRDRAPISTPAERRAALLGYAAGSFHIDDLARAATSTLPRGVEVQLRTASRVEVGPAGELDDPASATIRVADRTLLLVIRDPNRPDVSLPVLLASAGIALASLLGALIFAWSRNERMRELEREAGQDALTGLKNRRRFEQDLQLAVARSRREGTSGALLLIDLDHFKQVNDSLGHPAGDRLITEIAAVLRERARESDSLARLGGDEFALLLPRCSVAEARIVGEAIASAIREHRSGNEAASAVTASIGIAMFGGGSRASAELVASEADTAMYAAKDAGRDRVQVFDPDAVRDEAPEPG